MRLREQLAGSTVLLTGVTGFVGEALLARILRDLPDTSVVALVRPRGPHRGPDRVARLLTKPAFKGIDTAAALAHRITVIEGDLAHVPPIPGNVDTVVHCAGEVSFDPTIDEAFEVNLHGTVRLLERVQEAVAAGRDVHYLHVSTAYVSGRRRGEVAEAPVVHDVDWRSEAAAAKRISRRLSDDSRDPKLLAEFQAKADRRHGPAGPMAAAADAERRRKDWVNERQRAAGGERARSLGWTDVYTFTKAMGERAVEEYATAHDIRTTVLRPSIIESALSYPYPGWIEGYKMAEPIIMAYGRGDLPEFPAAGDSVVDIIPIDLVVNAIIAAAARPPATRGEPRYLHVSSGYRNPLTFRMLYLLVREYFSNHPFDMGDRGAVRLPTWAFPGSEVVEQALVRGERVHAVADRVLDLAPRSARVRQFSRDLDRQKDRLEFLRRHMDLYRSYTQVELRFVDDAPLALHGSLDPADLVEGDGVHGGFGFDSAVVDWTRYIRDIHCPAVTAPVRKLDDIRRRRAGGPPTRRSLPQVGANDAPILAVFDMDGTLLPSNVVETLLWLRLPEMSRRGRAREAATLLREVPRWVAAERRDRGAFLRAVYRRFAGADLDALDAFIDQSVAPHLVERLSGAAVRRVREHRAAGHRTVLITGSVAALTRPLAPLFDIIVAAELATGPGADGRPRATGFLTHPPLVGESRAAWLRGYAARVGADLGACYAYGDSHSDLPVLRAVGRPTAVSPDVALYRAARAAAWPVEDWTTNRSASRWRLPS
jgi:phosphoserine phosphatase/nucleoside-diphosphate-sugar epimerase